MIVHISQSTKPIRDRNLVTDILLFIGIAIWHRFWNRYLAEIWSSQVANSFPKIFNG